MEYYGLDVALRLRLLSFTISVPRKLSMRPRWTLGGMTLGQDGTPLGLTVNSFASVSLEPPLVMFCIDKKVGSYQGVVDAADYAVHILGVEQRGVSNRFATRGADKFADVPYEHTILIGQGERLNPGSSERHPLGYLRGRYAEVD